jgi:DNA-binding PucR family transcriptional regulator
VAAGWPLPAKIAAVAFDVGTACPPLPPGALADWTRQQPCALLPDPDGPGRAAAIDRALRGCHAAIGPAVPLSQAAASLRWARRALDLAARGLLAGGPPVRCDRQLSALILLGDEELARALCAVRLAPLQRLRPGQRDRIADTTLSWLLLGEKAAEVARHMHIHPQTVRYRLRQAYQLFGDQLRDPDSRFELQLALRAARGLRAAARPVDDR